MAVVSSMTFVTACAQGPSTQGAGALPAPGPSNAPSVANLPDGAGPVTIQCGDGKQAIVKQVRTDGQTVSQVECVEAAAPPAMRDAALLEDQIAVAPPAPVRRVVRTLPPVRERVIVREVPVRVDDDDEAPRVYRTSTRTSDDDRPTTTAPTKRSGGQSALIIGGSTAAGAGIGAVIGGKKGAIIGAILGGAGGTVYDRKTREKK
jgi:hypothetical protein